MAGFGKAQLESNFGGLKYFKLRTPDPKKKEESTEIILRLLPPMHSYADTGEWKFFYGSHYGHYGNNPKDPSRPRSRPFGCIQKKNRQKDIVTRCPKCDQIEEVRRKLDAREDVLAEKSGLDKKDPAFREVKNQDTACQALTDWIIRNNCDKKFWINAMSKDGDFGVLQLSYTTTMEKLLPLLKELRDKNGLDALDPTKGVFLRFTRSGRKPRVVDDVKVLTETITKDGEELERKVFAPMTDEMIEKALKVCPDLSKDVVKFIDAETMGQLIELGDADPNEVDRIWPDPNAKKPQTKTMEAVRAVLQTVIEENLGMNQMTPVLAVVEPVMEKAEVAEVTVKAVVEAAAPPVVSEEDDEDEKELARLQAKKAARAAAKAAPVAPKAAPDMDVSAADDFLAKFSS